MPNGNQQPEIELPRYGKPPQEDGGSGGEWRTQATYLGFPLIHVAYGKDENGKRRVAKGVIAIGQYAIGAITIAQFGVALVFGFGQFIVGTAVVAQVAVAGLCGIGQVATGYVAIGQLAVGYYVLAQVGLGEHVWTPELKDPEAVRFFEGWWQKIRSYWASSTDSTIATGASRRSRIRARGSTAAAFGESNRAAARWLPGRPRAS